MKYQDFIMKNKKYGRSYVYQGKDLRYPWWAEDKDGKRYDTKEQVDAVIEAAQKEVEKKATVKKRTVTKKED